VINSRSHMDLRPAVRDRMLEFVAIAELELSAKWDKRVKLVATSTLRDNEMQASLYAQGRTAPGKIVTNSKPGDSWHNYACAVDYALQLDGTITWEPKYYEELGVIAKRLGLTWGGDWDADGQKDKNDFDLVHFQWTGGLTLADLKAGRATEIV